MWIRARVENRHHHHHVTVTTGESSHALAIAAKPGGHGSATNGGELLCLALATCYCNDIYREAAARGIVVEAVEVEAEAEFGGPGEPAKSVRYRANIQARGSAEAVRALAIHTDTVAEVQNTLRTPPRVELTDVHVVSV